MKTGFLLCILIQVCLGDYINIGSVFYTPEQGLYFVPNVLNKTHSIAYGTYEDRMGTNGWGVLEINAGFEIPNEYQGFDRNMIIMRAAGFLEGHLTTERIEQHATNMYDFFFVNGIKKNSTKTKIVEFMNEQEVWMRQQIQLNNNPIWRHAAYILSQYDGLLEGYNQAAANEREHERKLLKKVSKLEFDIINNSGELLDLESAVNPDDRPNFMKMEKHEIIEYLFKTTHCSALIKLTPGFENILMSHSSWFTYQAMLRIFKHYNFNIDDPYTSSKAISFSSYPGQLNSLDDFYLMSNNLVMIQTTNGILNTTIYDKVDSNALFAWHRVRIANMMASNGYEWGSTLSLYNSGTYNNQYMVIDLNKIQLNAHVDDGALWVVEQIPGLVMSNDQTDILRAGYWASYNVPFYENIFNLSGYPSVVDKYGPEFSYQLAPRAKIFRRDQSTVHDIGSMQAMMRYNSYKNDQYSDGDACKTICCRGDITGTSAGGCYDTKVTDYFNAYQRGAFILNGPTTSNGIAPFSWDKFAQLSHMGMPNTFNFSFVYTKPFF